MPIAPTTRMPDRTGDCELFQRRGWDSNPRWTVRPTTVFETAPFNHSGTPPRLSGSDRVAIGAKAARRRSASGREELRQQRGALGRQDASGHGRAVVEPWLAQDVEDAAG